MWIDARRRDLRFAVRSLARTPGFAITVVATLALGIGANTAVFSALDAVLLRPLPFPESDRLVEVRQTQERTNQPHIAPVRLADWDRLNVTFDAITGYFVEDVSETSGDFPERVRRAFVAPRLLAVWGIGPALGRDFRSAEYMSGGPRAVIVSDRYWRVRLGGDAGVLSKVVRIGSDAFPIVGVMPASFRFPDRAVDLWFPVAVDFKYAQSRLLTWYVGIGRLKRHVTLEQARANLAAVQAQLGRQFPDSDVRIGVDIEPLKETAVGGVRRSLWLVFGAVSLLLLITCTNVAALLLARAAQRRHEISVRLSLGASRMAVVAQMLTEIVALSLAGALLGLFFAAGAIAAFRSAAADLPRIDEIVLDWRILIYTLASTLSVALLCGLLPALRASRDRMTAALGESARTQVSSRNPLQWFLVGAQVALSVTLLAGAGLLVRSLHELSRVNPGFETSHVLTFRVSGNYGETGTFDRLLARIDRTIDRLRALPGVEAVATSGWLPGVPAEFEVAFAVVEARDEATRRLVAERRVVSPEYFSTMQIPLLEGTPCERQTFAAPRVVMVNRAFANRYLSDWPSPIGLHLRAGDEAPTARITGIVADTREQGLDRAPVPTVYGCFSAPGPTPHFLVRTSGDPLQLAHTVRLTIKELEPLRSVYDIAALEDRIDGAFSQNRLRTWLLALFAAAALALSSVGVYGTLSYVVNLRRREVALRVALGAARIGIVGQFLRQGVQVVGAACIAGLALSFGFSRVLAGMLYGVSAIDPAIFAGVIAVVLAVGALAASIPAARAARVEPSVLLREG